MKDDKLIIIQNINDGNCRKSSKSDCKHTQSTQSLRRRPLLPSDLDGALLS